MYTIVKRYGTNPDIPEYVAMYYPGGDRGAWCGWCEQVRQVMSDTTEEYADYVEAKRRYDSILQFFGWLQYVGSVGLIRPTVPVYYVLGLKIEYLYRWGKHR